MGVHLDVLVSVLRTGEKSDAEELGQSDEGLHRNANLILIYTGPVFVSSLFQWSLQSVLRERRPASGREVARIQCGRTLVRISVRLAADTHRRAHIRLLVDQCVDEEKQT